MASDDDSEESAEDESNEGPRESQEPAESEQRQQPRRQQPPYGRPSGQQPPPGRPGGQQPPYGQPQQPPPQPRGSQPQRQPPGGQAPRGPDSGQPHWQSQHQGTGPSFDSGQPPGGAQPPPTELDWDRTEPAGPSGSSTRPGSESESGPVPDQPPMSTGAPADVTGDRTGTGQTSTPAFSCCVDMIEAESELIVFVDTPGFEKEEIEIKADEHSLILTAERAPEIGEDQQIIQQERPTTIQREIPLPTEVDIDEAEATYDNGVSRITLPKHERDESRHTIGFQ